MKRFTKAMVALLLMAAMTVTLCPAVSAANYRNFVDVPWSYEVQYRDAINYAADNGLMLGYDSGYFMPDQYVTRQEFIVVMFRASGDTGTYNDAAVFTDVSASSPFYNAIGWAINKGITAGTSATTFSPENLVTREQAMLFLYRFAGLLGYDRTADEDISQAGDYNLVETYAYPAFSWAYEYGILTRQSNSENINPKGTIVRKNSAFFINKFRTNIEGIVFGRDNYCFNNIRAEFEGGYAIGLALSADDWNLFGEYALNQGLSNDKIKKITSGWWQGACYGMAVTCVLDYYGKIDMNDTCCNDVSTIYGIPALIDLTNPAHKLTVDNDSSSLTLTVAESKLNLYQISQHIPKIAEWCTVMDESEGLNKLLNDLDHSGLGVLCYYFTRENGRSGGHAVVAYGKPIETENGYRVKVYDNQVGNQQSWLEITRTGNELTGVITKPGATDYITYCVFRSDFDVYDTYGFAISEPDDWSFDSSDELDNYVMIEVCATGDFTVTNTDGESFTFDLQSGTGVTGDMKIVGMNLLPYGEDSPCYFQFLVEPSEDFFCTVENDAELISFYVTETA